MVEEKEVLPEHFRRLVLPLMSPDSLPNDGFLQFVKNIVMILGFLGLLHQNVELLLQGLPPDFDAFQTKLIFGPLLQFDVDRRVESAWKNDIKSQKIFSQSLWLLLKTVF